MQFTVRKETILKPLQLVCSIIERRVTSPILSNILLSTHDTQLSMTSTDMELEMIANFPVNIQLEGRTTISARKFLNICRALPNNTIINFNSQDNKAIIITSKGRFSLSTLPSEDFPNCEGANYSDEISLPQVILKALFDETSFAMAIQDARYYLNGLLLEYGNNTLRAVATDGHRLALGTITTSTTSANKNGVIIPRKAVIELGRLLNNSNDNVTIAFNNQQIKVKLSDVNFTSKLIDGTFPNYERVLPLGGDKEVLADRAPLKMALSRVAILSRDKHQSVRINIKSGLFKATIINQEQESAEEEINVEYEGEALEVAFNNSYLLDLLNAMPGDKIRLIFSDESSSALITPANKKIARQYVIMPIRI